jgi:hypothetical protein
MDKGTKNALLYTAGAAAAYLGYRYYKKRQGLLQQAPSTTAGNMPPQTAAAIKQVTTTQVSKAPASPTFGGASATYVTKLKQLQTLVGVKADGIMGPITQKAAGNFGVNYMINATTIDRAIQTVISKKSIPAKTSTVSKYVQIVNALSAKKPVRFLRDINASTYIFDGNKSYKKTDKIRRFTINTTLGSTWSAFGFGASGDKVLIYQGSSTSNPLYEIPVDALKLI